MKRKIFILIICILAFSLMIFSCDMEEGGSGDGGVLSGGGFVFSEDAAADVVASAGVSDEEFVSALNGIRNSVAEVTGRYSALVLDNEAEGEHEIVIGDTSREISTVALERLRAKIKREIRNSPDEDKAAEDLIGYTVYSDGSSVAVVWSNDIIKYDAIEYFLENYVTSEMLVLSEGYSKTVTLSYTACLEEKDAELMEQAWAALSAELAGEPNGEEIVESLKLLYTIYTDDMYVWLANLYEPRVCVCEGACQGTENCYGGGFYHSNSARDNLGFLPDIASTWSAMSFMSSTGMVSGSYATGMPDWLKEDIGAFIRYQQWENGYFYHPLWGEAVDADMREENLKGAKSLLASCGVEPLYAYPGAKTVSADTEHIYGKSTVALTASLVQSRAVLPQYESVSAFRAWLDGWYANIEAGKTHFYSMGDELQSQVVNMRMYSEPLGADLLKITTDFLTSHQKENGLWDDELDYTATNAVHKITDVYNAAETEIPNADKIVEAAMEIISCETELDASVDLYNAWSCIPYVVKNLRSYAEGDEAERNAKADKIVADMREAAPTAIIGAFEKIAVFRKPDGSFSYGPKFSAKGDAGAPMAIPNTYEGDVGGNGICVTSLVSQIYGALDTETFVPLFNEIDHIRFIDILENLGGIEKTIPSTESIVYDFEDSALGDDVPPDLKATATYGSFEICQDKETENKYLKFTSGTDLVAPQTHPSMSITANPLSVSPNYAVMEMELFFPEGRGGHQLLLYGKGGFILQISITVEDGIVKIYNSAENANILASLPTRDWFKLRIEYFWDEGYIAVYINDSKTPSGVSRAGSDTGKHSEFSYLHFGAARAQEGTTYIDNVKVETAQLTASTAIPTVERKVHDFENLSVGDTAIPFFTVRQGSGSVKVGGDAKNKYLEQVASPGKPQSQFVLWSDKRADDANLSVIDMDMRIVEGDGTHLVMYSEMGFILQLNFVVQGTYIVITNSADSNYDIAVVPKNEFFHFRLEYLHEEGVVAIYIDGEETPSGITTVLPTDSKGHGLLTRIFYYSSSTWSCVSHIDNVSIENVKSTASVPETDNKPSGKVDFEDTLRYPIGSVSQSFSTPAIKLQKYGSYFSGEQVAITESGDNRYLTLSNGKAFSGVQNLQAYPAALTDGEHNAAVLEMKMNIASTALDNDILSLQFRKAGTSENTLTVNFRVIKTTDGDKVFVSFIGADGSRVFAVAGDAGKDFVIKIEYYFTEGAAKICIDGTRVATIHDSESCSVATGVERVFFVGNGAVYSAADDRSDISFDYISFENMTLTYTEDATDYPGSVNPDSMRPTEPDPEPEPEPEPEPDPEPEPEPEPEGAIDTSLDKPSLDDTLDDWYKQ